MKSFECDTYDKLISHSVDEYLKTLTRLEEQEYVFILNYFRQIAFNTIKHPMNRHICYLIADAWNLRRNTSYELLADCLLKGVLNHLKTNASTSVTQ